MDDGKKTGPKPPPRMAKPKAAKAPAPSPDASIAAAMDSLAETITSNVSTASTATTSLAAEALEAAVAAPESNVVRMSPAPEPETPQAVVPEPRMAEPEMPQPRPAIPTPPMPPIPQMDADFAKAFSPLATLNPGFAMAEIGWTAGMRAWSEALQARSLADLVGIQQRYLRSLFEAMPRR